MTLLNFVDKLHSSGYSVGMLFPKLLSVYVLVCPIDGKYRYVGLTCRPVEDRLRAHWISRERHSSCRDWLLFLEKRGLFPGVRKMVETYDPGMEEVWHALLIEYGHPILNRFTKPIRYVKGGKQLKRGDGMRIQYEPDYSEPVAVYDEPLAATRRAQKLLERFIPSECVPTELPCGVEERCEP